MKLASVTVAYKEPRFIVPFLRHHKDMVDEQIVLVSKKPWFGEMNDEKDNTAELARKEGATVIEYEWENEHEQRNAGQEYCSGYDWVITLDPDEFIVQSDQHRLREFLTLARHDAYTCQGQTTYWKSGYRIEPAEGYVQIIAVRPSVRFVDKRVVDCPWERAPVPLHHFAYARTNEEMAKKIAHFSHAPEFNTTDWYETVWKNDSRRHDLHPLNPHDYAEAVPAILPSELEELKLWPSQPS